MSEQVTFIDLFAGVGGFRRGMELAGHKCVGYCEWDKCASASYRMMHTITEEQLEYLVKKYLIKWNIGIKGLDWFVNNALNKNGKKKLLKEIEKEDYLNGEWYSNDIRSVSATNVPKCNAWCFGAPCQDFSIAGARKGLDGDRSSLVREVFRIIEEFKEEDRPEWLIYENVKGMLSSNNGWDFACILVEMESLGYDIEYQLFNSKDYGVPQNRERVYTIGHLRRCGKREILPIGGARTEINSKCIGHRKGFNHCSNVWDVNGLCGTLDCMGGGGREPHVITIGNVNPSGNGMNGNVFDSQGLSPTLTTNKGEGYKVMVREATKQGYAIATPGDSINLEQPNSQTRRGRVGVGVAQTLTTSCNQATLTNKMRIRKLTPRECFRLQGWSDAYFERAALVNSDSQLYKQAGNGVTVNVVHAIAEKLTKGSVIA